MFQFGRSISTARDSLNKIELERLIQGIKNPKQSFIDQIEQLRTVNGMDIKLYRELKKKLPYFVCGLFHPAIRRRENFARLQYFIIDIDHISESETTIDLLIEKLNKIPQIILLFKSPGNDGLKVLFKLKEPCSDAAMYSSFYKIFSYEFGKQNNILELVDLQTSDVTRACFLSYDPDAYVNLQAEPIVLENYLDKENYFKTEQKEILQNKEIKEIRSKADRQFIASDILNEIKIKLGTKIVKKEKDKPFVPEEVETFLAELPEILKEYEIELVGSEAINYGRKVKVNTKGIWAEVNVFFGKKGYSIVKTTKTGSNPELAELTVTILKNHTAKIM